MNSNKPISLPVEQTNKRQTWIIFGTFSVAFCCILLITVATVVPFMPLLLQYVDDVFDTPTPTADPNEPVEKIAFVSTRDGNPEIYVINTDGTNVVRLTNDLSGDYAPAWSPDGKRIAFYSERDGNAEIYVINADGSGLTRLTYNPANDYAPAWSPDGTRIAFHSHRFQGAGRIFVMNADGSGVTRLTDPAWDDWSPDWSPDGTQIVFNSSRYNNRDIWLMGADGSGMKNLTHDPADDWGPAWSPDGSRILFHSDRDEGFDIYSMNRDGSDVVQLTSSAGLNYDPDWSWDGDRIAFTSDRTGDREIWVMKPDGSDLVNVTNDPGQDWSPAWQPSETVPLVSPKPTFTPMPTAILPKNGNLALLQNTFASNSEAARPSQRAVDGSTSKDWGSGNFPPQWIEIDLGAPATIRSIKLLVTQYPSGTTIHRILMRTPDGEYSEVHRFEQFTKSGDWLIFKLPQPLKGIQFVRVETLKSPSWVGWVEIEVIGER